jgi:hypothetical protein
MCCIPVVLNNNVSFRDKVREVSGVLDNYIKHKHYQHATKLLKTNGENLLEELLPSSKHTHIRHTTLQFESLDILSPDKFILTLTQTLSILTLTKPQRYLGIKCTTLHNMVSRIIDTYVFSVL